MEGQIRLMPYAARTVLLKSRRAAFLETQVRQDLGKIRGRF